MNRFYILILLIVVMLSSCKVTDSNNCNLSEYKDVEIQFGFVSQSSIGDSYKLIGNKVTNSFNKDTMIIDEGIACNLFERTTQLFFKTQALNVPADSNNFFIYTNKRSNAQLRALWNPLHSNKGNEEFKALYQEYMDIIEKKDAK